MFEEQGVLQMPTPSHAGARHHLDGGSHRDH